MAVVCNFDVSGESDGQIQTMNVVKSDGTSSFVGYVCIAGTDLASHTSYNISTSFCKSDIPLC